MSSCLGLLLLSHGANLCMLTVTARQGWGNVAHMWHHPYGPSKLVYVFMTQWQSNKRKLIGWCPKDVPYALVKNIDFVGKKKSTIAFQGLEYWCGDPSANSTTKSRTPAFEEATRENRCFLCLFEHQWNKASNLSLVESYSSCSVLFCSLCQSCSNSSALLRTMLEVCDSCNISVSQPQPEAAEVNTKLQSMSHLWLSMRAGRITAFRLRLLLTIILHLHCHQ